MLVIIGARLIDVAVTSDRVRLMEEAQTCKRRTAHSAQNRLLERWPIDSLVEEPL